VRDDPAAWADQLRDFAQGDYRVGLVHEEQPGKGQIEG
jgi:hypothetical protein